MQSTVWNGTEEEAKELQRAIARATDGACGCSAGKHCTAHHMMFEQRTIDGLVFARRIRKRLFREEFRPHKKRKV